MYPYRAEVKVLNDISKVLFDYCNVKVKGNSPVLSSFLNSQSHKLKVKCASVKKMWIVEWKHTSSKLPLNFQPNRFRVLDVTRLPSWEGTPKQTKVAMHCPTENARGSFLFYCVFEYLPKMVDDVRRNSTYRSEPMPWSFGMIWTDCDRYTHQSISYH